MKNLFQIFVINQAKNKNLNLKIDCKKILQDFLRKKKNDCLLFLNNNKFKIHKFANLKTKIKCYYQIK